MVLPKTRKKITIAVRDFALPLARSGGLGRSSGGGLPIDLGQEIHVATQARLKNETTSYKAELPLQTQLEGERYTLRLRGRCDGYFEQTPPLLEEIKSSFGIAALKTALAEDEHHPYILQAKVYGYLFYLKHDTVPELRLRLIDSRTLKEELWPLTLEPLVFGIWFTARQRQIEEDLASYAALVKARKGLAKKLYFPFARKRPKQEELVAAVKQNLEANRHLLLQAPTGLGKTAGVLFPALVHALERGSPVVYVAPKNSQFKAAIDLGQLFQKSRIPLKVLVLTSKTKACHQDQILCASNKCPLAIAYYDRVEEFGLSGRDRKKHLWDYRYFQRLADRFEVCPYALAMERIQTADLIICDYNYIFSPNANFFDRYLDPILPMKKPVLVIDEAHNLYERVIENFSPEVRLSVHKAFLQQAALQSDDAFRALILQAIDLMRTVSPVMAQAKILREDVREGVKELLIKSLQLMTSRWGGEGLPGADDPLFQFFTQWFDLNEIFEASSDTVPLIYKREDGDEVLRAQCIDPSAIIQPLYLQFLGVIAFSATLKPFAFYRHMMGFNEALSDCVEFESPFPRAHKKIMIIPQVQTSFRERDRHYERIASILEKVVALKAGPYLAFFSSYQFLRNVQSALSTTPGCTVYAQSSAFTSQSLQTVIDLLEKGQGTQLILAVQGGSLSEGIDFRGLGLCGVFIIGPAVPSASFERRLMQDHFEKLCGDGRSFAYVYPAMTKSIQAAGRIVRDEPESGLIILMDPRFLEKSYADTMPADWFNDSPQELLPQYILQEIRDFWDVRTDAAKETNLEGMIVEEGDGF